MISPIFLCVLFISAFADQQQCTANRKRLLLGFDDIQLLPTDYFSTPWPYRDFLFTRGGGWMDKHVPVINTTGVPYYSTAASSRPNVILTTAESLTMEQMISSKGNPTFVLHSLSMTSIFIDKMSVFIEMSRNNTILYRQVVVLPIQQQTSVIINTQVNADKMVIGCVDPSFPTCAHIAYDDIALCYKHSQ